MWEDVRGARATREMSARRRRIERAREERSKGARGNGGTERATREEVGSGARDPGELRASLRIL